MKLFIGSEEEPAIIVRCLTPNSMYPTNRNISLTHLNSLLIDRGLAPFLQHVWRHFFEKDAAEGCLERFDKSRLTIAWNRIVCKEFKSLFPELVGTLAPGDYQMVKDHHRNTVNTQIDSMSDSGRKGVSESCSMKNLIACDGDLQTRSLATKRRTDVSLSSDSEPSGKRIKK